MMLPATTFNGTNSFTNAVKTNTLQSNTGVLTIGGDTTNTIAFTDNVTIGDMTLGLNNRINFFNNGSATISNPTALTRSLGSFYGFTGITSTPLPSQSDATKWVQIGNREGVYILSGNLIFEAVSTLTTVDYIWVNFSGASLGIGTKQYYLII